MSNAMLSMFNAQSHNAVIPNEKCTINKSSIRTHDFIAEEGDDWSRELIAAFEEVEFENEEISD